MSNLYKVVADVQSNDGISSREYVRVIESPIEITSEQVEGIVTKDACYKVEHGDSAKIISFEEITEDIFKQMKLTESFISFALNNDGTKDYISRESYNVA